MHITLAFLGEIDEMAASDLGENLLHRFNNYGNIVLEVKGIGTFSKRGEPKVIWAGIDADQSFFAMQQQIISPLQKTSSEQKGISPDMYTPANTYLLTTYPNWIKSCHAVMIV